MDSGLLNLLRKNSTKSDNGFTHVTSYGPHAKWFISDTNFENFWIEYCDLVSGVMNGGENKALCLAEASKKHMPVVADFNLKFYPIQNTATETYSIDFILEVVYCYQQAMLKVLQIAESCMELICCVLEAPEYMEDNLIVSNFRLHFPYCKTLTSVQSRLIRPLVIQMLRTRNVISRLSHQPVNDWETIIDPLTCEKPLMMYGSSDAPDKPKLDLEYLFHRINEDIIDTHQAPVLEIEDVFKLVNHMHVTSGIVSANMFNLVEAELDFWLPMLFSTGFWNGITLSKKEVPNKLVKSTNSLDIGISRSTNTGSSDTLDMEFNPKENADRFLQMLSRDRVEAENYWLDVGRALFGVYEGEDEGLDVWIEFTETSDVHTAEECKVIYPGFYQNPLTLKTLAWYARIDSPQEYQEWHKQWYYISLEKATSGLEVDVAEALYRVYWLEFACNNVGKGSIYQFKKHIWKKLDSGDKLRRYISDNFIVVFEKFRTEISIKIQQSTDNRYKDSAELVIKKTTSLINKLKTRRFKNAVLAESLELFKIDEFDHMLDSDPNIMGLVNGVIETCSKEAVFRDGKPEDYISKSNGLIWRKDLHWKHPLVMKVISWLSKVFPNKALLDYFGKFAGSCLKGRNSDKLFFIMTGDGNNSKSMIKKAFECTFGAYSITFPTAVFTGKRSAGGPDPAVARSKYARVAFAQEPDADAPLKNGFIKEITGGDRFFVRFLNDNGGEIEPMFKLALFCNAIPTFSHAEKAIRTRVRILPYLSNWVENPPKSIDEQFKQRRFKIDVEFEKQIPEMAPAIIWYFVQMYAKYKKEGLIEPEIVTKTTKEYWEENDFYQQFITENLEKSYKDVPCTWPSDKPIPVDEEAKITGSQLYSRFRDWFRENYSSMKIPDKPIVTKEMEQRLGKMFRRAWHGIKWKIVLADI